MGKHNRKRDIPVIHPPENYARIVDAVCERDREYFEAHPGETSYARPYIPGEFHPGPPLPQDAMVEVCYLGPGLRSRRPYLVLGGAD